MAFGPISLYLGAFNVGVSRGRRNEIKWRKPDDVKKRNDGAMRVIRGMTLRSSLYVVIFWTCIIYNFAMLPPFSHLAPLRDSYRVSLPGLGDLRGLYVHAPSHLTKCGLKSSIQTRGLPISRTKIQKCLGCINWVNPKALFLSWVNLDIATRGKVYVERSTPISRQEFGIPQSTHRNTPEVT